MSAKKFLGVSNQNVSGTKAMVLHQCDRHALVVHGTETEPQGLGVIESLKEGKSINGQNLIVLDPRDDGYCNVEQISISHGPVQVATKAYRDGYDRIFGSKN